MSKEINDCGFHRLKVEGTGSVMVQPNTAVVNIGVVTENKLLMSAQDDNTSKMIQVLNSLKNNSIPPVDIQTQLYSIFPQYDFADGQQVFRAYRVEHILQVRIKDMSKIGVVIDDAVASGANQIGNVSFSVDDESVYYRQALNLAVEDATAKARTIGRKLNVDVSPIPVQITELGYRAQGPEPLVYRDVAAATPVQSGQIEVTARIEAVFKFA